MSVNPFSELADIREVEASQYSIEEIMKATARNALTSTGTKPLEKVSLALATMPEADPIKADAFIRNVIDEMVDGGEITLREGGTYKGILTILAKSSTSVSAEIFPALDP